MVISPVLIVALLAIVLALFVIAMVIKSNGGKMPKNDARQKAAKSIKNLDSKGFMKAMESSKFVQNVGSLVNNTDEMSQLFRKAGNPWNVSVPVFNFIRFGGTALCIILALVFYPLINWYSALIFGAAGLCFFILPKKKYSDLAKFRESQWNQLYQFMWVIKHNAGFYDAKKVFAETSNYISDHNPQLTEIIEGTQEFSTYWNPRKMDPYIEEKYGLFDIPKELYQIMLTSEQTGQYPNKELDSLRTIIEHKMDFYVKEVLSTVSMKATLSSTPMLLISMALVILVPVMIQIFQAFS